MIKKIKNTRNRFFTTDFNFFTGYRMRDSLKLAANESEEAQKQPAATALLDKQIAMQQSQNQNGTQKKGTKAKKKVSTRCHCPCDSH